MLNMGFKHKTRAIHSLRLARMPFIPFRGFFLHIFGIFCEALHLVTFGVFRATLSPSISGNKNTFILGRKQNRSLDCLSSSSNSSDSEGDNSTEKRAPSVQRNVRFNSATEMIASEAVAHSYEDITQPNYQNYLWLSSQWDRTDLFSAFYFLLNWVEHFKASKRESSEQGTDALTLSRTILHLLGKRDRKCPVFLGFITNLTSLPDSFFPKRRIALPKRLKTLVLDLDETLIHSTSSSCPNFDFMVEVLVNRASCLYYVYKRPNLNYFLSVVSHWYTLVIYTASVREYADPVIDLIDETGQIFKRRLFRTDCPQTPSSHYLKDLSLVDSDISKICLLDNSAASFAFYPDNAIPIESWKEDPNDSALLDLLPFLDALRFVEDVRSVLSLRRFLLFCNK